MIQKAIKAILKADTDFLAAIGQYNSEIKAFPAGYIPQGVPLPYCSYQLANSEPFPGKDETSYQDNDNVIIRIYDDNYDDVMELARLCRVALDKKRDTFNGVVVTGIDFMRWNDDHVMINDKPVFFYELEFECYNEK